MAEGFSDSAEGIDVGYVAHLARMHLTEEEAAHIQPQLEQILDYVRQLSELDVDGIEPTSHAIPVENVLREDEERECLDPDAVMRNAPNHHDQLFVVPRIVE